MLILFFTTTASAHGTKDKQFISPADLASERASYQIIDLRSVEHYFKNHVPGALSLPLQEISQKEYKCLPDYKLIKEKGPDHKKMFCINVTIKEKMYGTGFGDNKKEAEQNAAKDTLKKLKMIK